MASKKGKAKNKGGRKLFDGKPYHVVMQKLEEVWALAGTDAEAAFLAGISPSALAAFLKAHPDVSARKEALKERPVLLARAAVIASFDGHKLKKGGRALIDPELALKYLERRKKGEFSPRSELTGPEGAPLPGTTVQVYLPHNGRNALPAAAKPAGGPAQPPKEPPAGGK